MILDNKFRGTLDQGRGVLLVFDNEADDQTYAHAVSVIANTEKVVETLFKRAQQIS